jgi:hypothetical protein
MIDEPTPCIDAVLSKLRNQIHKMEIDLIAADEMAKAIDGMIELNALDSRSPVADARLNYGEPGIYKYSPIKS